MFVAQPRVDPTGWCMRACAAQGRGPGASQATRLMRRDRQAQQHVSNRVWASMPPKHATRYVICGVPVVETCT